MPESAAQQDEIIRGIAATEEEELEAQQEVSEYSDSSDDDYQPIPLGSDKYAMLLAIT